MRLWSLHPKYFDRVGLVALWREGLLAQAVLAGKTKGYTNHPQLLRFKSTPKPLVSIGFYLEEICNQADRRGYSFNRAKILKQNSGTGKSISVTKGQLQFEWVHLCKKLRLRDPQHLEKLCAFKLVQAHPSFKEVVGELEAWERI